MTHASITRNGLPIAGAALGAGLVRSPDVHEVVEEQEYGFGVEGREADTSYMFRVGDAPCAASSDGSIEGRGFGTSVLWEDQRFFDGARGIVTVSLLSRPSNQPEGAWTERAEIAVQVRSSKLSEARFQAMYGQLRTLMASLVLDLYAKNRQSLSTSGSASSYLVRSSLLELRAIAELWPGVARRLEEISHEPSVALRRSLKMRSYWGAGVPSFGALRRMASLGKRPGASGCLPVTTLVSSLEETVDTIEHQCIRGFLLILRRRLLDCLDSIHLHRDGIERDRVWRDTGAQTRSTLYETEDLPRLRRLAEYENLLVVLKDEIQRALRMMPLRDVRPSFQPTPTPTFLNVQSYNYLFREMNRFLSTGVIVLDESAEERMKSTHRMYEQWVFLQIAAAFKEAGLECMSRDGVLRQSKQFRFTLDIDRGARLTFRVDDLRSISIRYEPWIYPEDTARQNRESLFQASRGGRAWIPDIIIEFSEDGADPGEAPELVFVVAVDAKYTAAIRDHHWDGVRKYLEIRATKTNQQVVKQLWLAYLGQPDSDIAVEDAWVSWTPEGPSCDISESIYGKLPILPPSSTVDGESEEGWISGPEERAREFVDGLLAYVGFTPSRPSS